MLVLIHKECGGPALDESPVGEVCAIPIDRFPFLLFYLPGRDRSTNRKCGCRKSWESSRLRSSPSKSLRKNYCVTVKIEWPARLRR